MGEKIIDLVHLSIKEFNLTVELNEASSANSRHEIHLQGDGVRIDLTPYELILAGATFLQAAEKLRQLKKIPDAGFIDATLN